MNAKTSLQICGPADFLGLVQSALCAAYVLSKGPAQDCYLHIEGKITFCVIIPSLK